MAAASEAALRTSALLQDRLRARRGAGGQSEGEASYLPLAKLQRKKTSDERKTLSYTNLPTAG